MFTTAQGKLKGLPAVLPAGLLIFLQGSDGNTRFPFLLQHNKDEKKTKGLLCEVDFNLTRSRKWLFPGSNRSGEHVRIHYAWRPEKGP